MNDKLTNIPKVKLFKIYDKDSDNAIKPGVNKGKYLATSW